jgi:hypothetical protein
VNEVADPTHWRFGGGAAETVLHPIVLVAMLVTIILLLLLPRKYMVVPFLLAIFLVPLGQHILLGGLHVFVFRLIVLSGWARLLWTKLTKKGGPFSGRWNSVDTAFLLWVIFHVTALTLLYQEKAAVINQVGYLWDYVGAYLLLRFMIQDEQDVNRAIRCFAAIAAILAVCMARERLTGQNIFGLLGGVRLIPQVRDGWIRSQAVFQHPILAGTFGATLLPLFVLLWKCSKSKVLAVVGVTSSMLMALLSASSTALMGVGSAILAVCFWPFRRRMRTLRWGILLTVVGLHLVMKAPVWFLIGRISLIPDSSSYHRAQLVNQFILHFKDWAFLGAKSNAEWGNEMIDTSNQFVEEGESGGLIAFVFFLAVIWRSFGRVGKARGAVEGNDQRSEWYLWLLGAALFSHVIAFFGIFYFDQLKVAWFALLAMISAAAAPFIEGRELASVPRERAVLAQSQSLYLTVK